MSAVLELTNLVKKMGIDLSNTNKTVEAMRKGMDDRETLVAKRLFGGGGPSNGGLPGRGRAWQGDQRGNPQHDIMDVIDPRRTKSLGTEFGQFLREVAILADPTRFVGEDPSAVSKSLLSRHGCMPISKTPLAEGSGATGGYTVPTQFVADLYRLANEESFLKQECRTIPMTGRQIFVPVLDQTRTPPTGGSSFYGGIVWTWQPENSNYQTNASTQPYFRQIELVARDLVGIVVASNQLLQDNAVALDTILTTLFKEAMAWAYDYFFLRGTGSNQPLGMLNSPCLYNVDKITSAHFNFLDAAKMLARIVPSSYKTSCWIVHPSVLPDLITMTNGATNSPFLVWLNPVTTKGGDGGPAANAIPAMFLGRPLFVTEKLPAIAAGVQGAVMLVDANKYLVGDRMAIQIEASPYPNFVLNQMTWRIIARFDGQPELNAPITLADGSYQVSTVVALTA